MIECQPIPSPWSAGQYRYQSLAISGGPMPAVGSDEEFLAYNQGVDSDFRAPASGLVPQPAGRPVGDGGARRPVVPGPAVVTPGEEPDQLYGLVSGGDCEKNTDRVFPVIVLDGVPSPG